MPSPVETYERLGAFYLGRPFDLEAQSTRPEPLLYDSKDLVTHAVIVGMTGSGKTGLGISLIEEAALDGVPVLAIDPKGDLGNLLLSFPALAPSDFLPWVDPAEAERRGVTVEALAQQEAQSWRKGLEESGQSAERIARLRAAADFVVYTPGSRAGRLLSISDSFEPPPASERGDPERLAEAVSATVTGLLALVGIEAEPVQSREHLLLSAIVTDAWSRGATLDLVALIERIQRPPFSRVGVIDVEAFYPEKERFALAMRVNGLLASPGFSLWLEGEPLDVGKLLFTSTGKPRVAIVSVAHLSDQERMFFVTVLLERVVRWMRAQSGTTSLRALLYVDEVAGYMPPVANPPSKQALLTLLKQARAFGLGVVLATQNPVDLDYKGLSNAGTWFVGRLQTERDKARLLDGLEGAIAGRGHFDRAGMERVLSALPKRTFLLHDVHEEGPIVFQTRWAMSYLRGPLTKDQIRLLQPPGPPSNEPEPARSSQTSASQPVLSPGVPQFFAPPPPTTGPHTYEAFLFAKGTVRFVDAKRGVDVGRAVEKIVRFGSGADDVDWASAVDAGFRSEELRTSPSAAATFGPLPPAATRAASYPTWLKEFSRWLQQDQVLLLFHDPVTGSTSAPGEDEATFRARVVLAEREARDQTKEALRRKLAPKIATLEERIRRAEQAVRRQAEQASDAKIQTGISVLGTIAGALVGRKKIGVGALGRAASAARGVGRSMRESSDVERANETLRAHQAQLDELVAEIESKTAGLEAGATPANRTFSTVEVRPKKTHVTAERVVLVWRVT